jgi:hypothetical protein
MSQATCCVACSTLMATAKAVSAVERKTRWMRRVECGTIASVYAFAMVVMLMTCFPGRAPLSTSFKQKVGYNFQVKVGAWQRHYALTPGQQ